MASDLISREAMKMYIDCGHLRSPTELCFSELDVVRMLDKQPTVDAEPVRHGRLGVPEIVGYDGIHAVYACSCSVCHKYVELYKPNYCPYCGAKMDGGKQDAD